MVTQDEMIKRHCLILFQRRRSLEPEEQEKRSLEPDVSLISHQPAVLFSRNKSTTSNQSTLLFSQNKSATNQYYFSLRTNQHQQLATSQTNRPM
jgi:hypothetical protein